MGAPSCPGLWWSGPSREPKPSGARSCPPYLPKVKLQLADRALEVPGPDRGFEHTWSEDGTRLLVVPTKTGKRHHSEWPEEERPFRSLMLDPRAGRALSVGFPKFFNYGEAEEDTELLEATLASDEPVWFTGKIDGSLVIRSVIDGEVHMRTRGMQGLGEFAELAERVVAEKLPILADPDFEPDASLLLELVSPDFRLVIDYPEDGMTLVGAVDHATLRLWDVPELQRLGTENGIPVAEMVELPRDPEALTDVVRAWRDREGVVASCAEGQVLVKVKASEYLARHRLRFAVSARIIREICIERDVRSLEDFGKFLEEQNADWELSPTRGRWSIPTWMRAPGPLRCSSALWPRFPRCLAATRYRRTSPSNTPSRSVARRCTPPSQSAEATPDAPSNF